MVLILGICIIAAFIFGKCSGSNEKDEETLKLREEARIEDSTRHSQVEVHNKQFYEDSIIADRIYQKEQEAKKLHREKDRIASEIGRKNVESAEAENKKIKDEINSPTNNNDDRINRIDVILSKLRKKNLQP